MTLPYREFVMRRAVETVSNIRGVRIERNRRAAFTPEDTDLLSIKDASHTVLIEPHGHFYTLQFAIEGIVGGETDDDLGPALNQRHAEIVTAVLSDWTLGGAVEEMREDGMDVNLVRADDSADPLLSFRIDMTVTYYRADGDPYATGE